MNQPTKFQASKIPLRYIQQGFTLIELLVAMSITLLIIAGISALFANTIFNTKTLNSATAINEESIRINGLLGQHIRMSGYVDWLSNASLFNAISSNEASNSSSYNLKRPNQFSMFQRAFAAAQVPSAFANVPLPLFGCSNGYNNPTTDSFTAINTCKPSSSSSKTAAITVAYQVKSQPQANYSALLPITNGGAMSGDCLGRSVTTEYTVNRFFLEKSTTTVKTGEPTIYDLKCLSSENTKSEPLASNIEQWVITYGVPGIASGASPSNDTQIAKYLTAEEVTNKNAWNQVMAVRSCFLIVGERGSAVVTTQTPSSGTKSNRTDCLGQFMRIGPELRLRQSFTQTIILRNQIHTPNIN